MQIKQADITQLVFDLSPNARNPRPLIENPTSPRWLVHVLVGSEGSFFRKKVFLRPGV